MKSFAFLFATLFATTLSAAEPISLFNGEDLTGWKFETNVEDAELSETWSVKDGVIVCTGQPKGVLRTLDEYENYTLSVEWRFTGKAGNSGVLVHTTDPRFIKMWPRSLEVQGMHGTPGELWVIGMDIKMTDEGLENEQKKKHRRHFNYFEAEENPLGEWNQMTIHCRGDEIEVFINDKKVNSARNLSQSKGAICLQSEGVPTEFRNVVLTPLESE